MHTRARARSTIALLCVAAAVAACRSSETTASDDVVASSGAEKLTTADLGIAFGQSRSRRLRAEELRRAAELWLDFQLLARAAATQDSVANPGLVDEALWGPMANARARKWYQRVSASWPTAAVTPRELYDSSQVLVVRQILLRLPPVASAMQAEIVRRSIDSVRRSLTRANFAQVAARSSADSLSRKDGGLLPAWPAHRNIMLPAFEAGIIATKPGAISNAILTEFGAHIVYRLTWDEAQPRVVLAARQLANFRAESTYFHALETARSVTIVPDVAPLARAIVRDQQRYADSATVLARITGGDFTAATLVRWLRAYPPEQGIDGQITNAPDTAVPGVLRRIVRNELFLRQADSAGITLTPAERRAFDGELRTQIESAVGTLGLARRMVPDSVWKLPVPQRQAYLAARVQSLFTAMVRGTAATVPISPSLHHLLRSRYPDATISSEALDRALDRARKVRQAADSARNAAGDTAQADTTPRVPEPAAPPARKA